MGVRQGLGDRVGGDPRQRPRVAGGAGRTIGLSATVAAAGLLLSLAWTAPTVAQDWASRAFGIPTAALDKQPGPREKAEPAAPDDLRAGDVPLRSEAMLEALDLAYGRYKVVAQKGGWPAIPGTRMMRPGDDDERMLSVRRRLTATGELKPSAGAQSFAFDGEVESAVRTFQKRHGLAVTGRVDRATIAAMNVPVQARLAQIKLNYERIAGLQDRAQREERYILVNVPGFQLEAVEGGKVAQRHRVIAGRTERQTPDVKASVRALNFFPYWRVPDSVAQLDLAPRLIKEPEYLGKEQIRVLNGSFVGPEVDPSRINWSTFDAKVLKFRQDPGPQNALGLVRLDMPNEHGVYMHDTPMKPLFGRPQRAFSAGCVRVQDVFDLAAWIARDEPGMDRKRVDEILAAGSAVDITLARAVPVYFTYITAWADAAGQVEFRPDIYGRDGLRELSGDREADPDAPPPPSPGLAP